MTNVAKTLEQTHEIPKITLPQNWDNGHNKGIWVISWFIKTKSVTVNFFVWQDGLCRTVHEHYTDKEKKNHKVMEK